MAYERITGLVDLEKLENESELMNVTGGTAKKTVANLCVPHLGKSICVVHTHDYKPCKPIPVPEEPPQR